MSTSAIPTRRLDALVREHGGEDAEVHVVVPATHISRLQWLTDDTDRAHAEAVQRADAVAERLASDNAAPHAGDADPLQAIEDALRLFQADEIVVITHSDERAEWLEAGTGAAALEEFALPVTHLVADEIFDVHEETTTEGADQALPSSTATEALAHPLETTRKLATEAQRGRTPRAPLIAFTGLTLVIASVLLVTLVFAFLLYYLV